MTRQTSHEEPQLAMTGRSLSGANAVEMRELNLRAAGLHIPAEATVGDQAAIEAARERFRDPIRRVEKAARGRFISVAKQVGLSQRAGNTPRTSAGYFNFLPHNNTNITNPIPLVDTPEGVIAVQLGASWILSKARYGHLPESEAALSARVVSISPSIGDHAKDPQEIGYVRLGRVFRRDELNSRVRDQRGSPDLSRYPGRVVLGSSEGLEEDYISLVRTEADPAVQAARLIMAEQAAATFTVLSEAAALKAGVETHRIDADALLLAINTAHG